MMSPFFDLSTVPWKRNIWHIGVRVIGLDSCFVGFHIKCLSSGQPRTSRSSKKVNRMPHMADESNAFYVVRKGDMVGIYKNLSDCQTQVSPSVCNPSVSVYKGYCLRKETEDYLASMGLKDALYAVHAAHLKDDMFGTLVPCPFQQPDRADFLAGKPPKGTSLKKRAQEVGIAGYIDMPTAPANKCSKKEPIECLPLSIKPITCILEFDGASKGNPGQAGAGAVLRTEDGNVISHVREGLGIATNNAAEYRALILGMKYALTRGFKHIRVHGDSQLVCNQIQGLWQTKNRNMVDLCTEAKKLKDMFLSFNIIHVQRELNTIADNLANLAIALQDGEVCDDLVPLS